MYTLHSTYHGLILIYLPYSSLPHVRFHSSVSSLKICLSHAPAKKHAQNINNMATAPNPIIINNIYTKSIAINPFYQKKRRPRLSLLCMPYTVRIKYVNGGTVCQNKTHYRCLDIVQDSVPHKLRRCYVVAFVPYFNQTTRVKGVAGYVRNIGRIILRWEFLLPLRLTQLCAPHFRQYTRTLEILP